MTRHTIASRLAPVLLCVASMLATLGFGVTGAIADEPEADAPAGGAVGSITATFNYNGEAVDGAYFLLYKVVDWDVSQPDVPLADQLDDAFKADIYKDIDWSLLDRNVDSEGNDIHAQSWTTLSNTLFQTMKLDGFTTDPVAPIGHTNSEGVVTFTGLEDGVYFLVSPLVSVPKAVYSAQLVAVPSGTAAEHGHRQVTVTVKGTPWSGKDPIHVKKMWNDGNAADRPTSVKVTLYYQFDEEGPFEEYETVELNASNNWSYEWTRLPESMDYMVQETDVPEGYTMSMDVDRVSSTTSFWTITNSKPVPEQPVTPPVTPSTPTPTTPTPAQTGAEVATLCAVGLASLALGILLIVKARRSGSRE